MPRLTSTGWKALIVTVGTVVVVVLGSLAIGWALGQTGASADTTTVLSVLLGLLLGVAAAGGGIVAYHSWTD